MVTTHHGDNSDLIREVARLFLPEGARVADVTYGQGVFWRKVDLGRYTLMGSDLQMDAYRRGQLALFGGTTPHFLAADFCALPYQEQCLDVVVFDPPYQNMAEDHTCKGVGECHPYREFEGMQPSR